MSIIKKKIHYALLVLLAVSLYGCSEGKTITAPSATTITADPDTFSFSDGRVGLTENYADFTIIVLDVYGKPMNNIDLYIDSPVIRAMAAEGTMWFEHPYGTRVYNAITPTTDENGGYQLRVGFTHGGSLDYFDDIIIMSGSAEHAQIDFSVTP